VPDVLLWSSREAPHLIRIVAQVAANKRPWPGFSLPVQFPAALAGLCCPTPGPAKVKRRE